MSRLVLALVFSLFLIPSASYAEVVVSEIAWMGSTDNANAEWIELYNDGPTTDLSGWTLTAVDGQPDIALSGTIDADSYALLERTSDETVPGVTAFLVYTGSLGNTGEVLELRDDGGALIDKIDGSDDWALGGDNDTKQTLQRTGTPPVGAFVTAAPSPQGSQPVSGDTDEQDDDADAVDTSPTQRLSSGSVRYGTPGSANTILQRDPALTLDIPDERTVTVGVPSDFAVRMFRESGKEITNALVRWNFGDGQTAEGRVVEHTYRYTGEYLVTVTGERTGIRKGVRDTVTMIVRVVDPSVSISRATRDYVELTNSDAEPVDVSGFVLAHGGSHFKLPEGTHVLGNSSVRFPREVTALAATDGLALYQPGGTKLASYTAPHAKPSMRTVAYSSPVTVAAVEHETVAPTATAAALADVALPELAAVAQAFEGMPVGPDTNDSNGSLWWWLLGLAAAILAALASVSLIRKEQTEYIAGFEIESDE